MKGFTLISFLFSAFLSAIMILCLARTAHSFVLTSYKFQKDAKEQKALLNIHSILEQIALDLDSHRLKIRPIIHKIGNISFPDGSPNSVISSSVPIRPSDKGNAISSISLKSNSILRVSEVSASINTHIYRACSIANDIAISDDPLSFIGLSINGLVYLKGQIQSISNSPPCFELHLGQSKNMFLKEQNHLIPLTVRLLIPVAEEYTIYLSNDNELRYLQHSGAENIENHPIITGISEILFSDSLSSQSLCSMQAIVKFPRGAYTISASASLSRKNFLNILFNT